MSEPDPSFPTGPNRRLSRRRSAKKQIRVLCRRGGLDLGPNLALALIDVSETGVRLVVKEPLEKGREVSVSLEGQGNVRPILRVGNVTWSAPTPAGAYCVGVCFQKRLPYRDFLEFSREPDGAASALGRSAPPLARGQEKTDRAPAPKGLPATPERRHFERRPGQRLIQCRVSLPEGGPDLPAMIFDLSAAGVGLMASRQLRPGAALVLRIAAAGASRPALDLPARTAYGDEMGSGWFALGADFLRPLSEEQLEAILFRMGVTAASGE